MCMPYLNKLFGGGNRRERRNQNGGITPLPSLANVNQLSVDTVRTAKSGKSGKSGKSASRRSTNANQSSESSLESNAGQSMAVRNTSASAAPSVAPVEESRTHRSWWGYLGMNRNKKPSIDSL
ncbi:uncharacterized protein LOC108047093 [Drosophila rhopaloa]|uniref:Uncharacterized protein LOC108047093 n=1 Tax=Drosophila rhopaloa TaxID=1041015 RepID=A0A6P4F5J5_DRORH|nr:uncharacterized protein LOC108047093 [Drosophila rhopaloa]